MIDRPLACLFFGLLATSLSLVPLVASEPARHLTSTGTEKRDLRFFDDDTLVYCEQVGPRQLALVKLTLSTGASERLHPDATTNEFEPAFSPDRDYEAFVQNLGNLNLRLAIRRRDTGETAEFREGGFSGARGPTFTPDGRRVLYAYPEEGRQPIWSCDLQCQNRNRLIDSSGINNWPSVTPDGTTLIFGSTRDGNFEIYSADLSGETVVRLTDHPRQDIRPRLSSDGRQIAFTSSRDGNYEIFVMNLDGSRLRRITQHAERDDYPAWHPDGRLAWVAERDGRFDIHLISITP
ncbi:translocation protein TolB [Maioricimonas rarisocia]|uniref:Translocation protein TolB n=1 Tax=Maioricimonas rarisocia TaxID=2528026 RepID=A0A517Z1J1_9PLAN|nr:PD40 domain-containing protein [Maioricimonas rarisocia]QDU36351.1 translocation protein TolB [Maioricimonas rarisocia]